mgnify:CR=1 FL=1
MDGESALDHFLGLYRKLRVAEHTLNAEVSRTDPLLKTTSLPYPTSVNTVTGGVNADTVMGHMRAMIHFAVRVDETVKEAKERFERTLKEASEGDKWLQEHPLEVLFY